MLKISIGVALLLVIALIGSRRTFTRLYLPIGARLIFLTGTEFILVGVALGDELIGILDGQMVRSLTPLFSLGLGVIGLIFGIQLEAKKILRFPASYMAIALIQALCAMLVVFWLSWLALNEIFAVERQSILLASLVLAATAACTAQSTLALVEREFALRRAQLMELLRYVSSIDAVVGVLTLQAAFCVMHSQPVIGLDAGVSLQWFLLSVLIGLTTGLLLQLLTRFRCSEEELLIFVVGMALFSGGIALYLRLSPLFVNAVMGITAANLPGAKDRIANLLMRVEKPFYIVFLILAGAIWNLGSTWALPLAALYLALRFIGKLLGGFLAARITRGTARPPHALGLGLISQGGIAIAMVMNYYQLSSTELTSVVVSTVLIAVIVSEFASPALARMLLSRRGEVEP